MAVLKTIAQQLAIAKGNYELMSSLSLFNTTAKQLSIWLVKDSSFVQIGSNKPLGIGSTL